MTSRFDSNPTLPGVADPYPIYRSVRESEPVLWCAEAGLWAITRYADADAVLKDERFSRQAFLDGVEARMGHQAILEMQRHELVFTDNPRHRQLRALISEAITPQAVQALKPKIARLTEETLDLLLTRGRMHVIGDFARTLPTQVAAVWLGVPAEDRGQIVEWIFPLVAGRGVAREDLTTALLKAQRADREGIFTDEDLLSLIVAVFAAGHGPGIAMLANTWLALLREPSELAGSNGIRNS
jgi:cytochrome P450